MLDYDREADGYDETRGGRPRAQAAAAAIVRLLPAQAGVVLDVAGGTGIVGAELATSHRRVLVCDESLGMLRRASARLPGRVVRADATTVPIAAGSVDAVLTIWLLHLLDTAGVHAVIGEAARVLRDGGRYLTTVDKSASHRQGRPHPVTDSRAEVTAVAASVGMEPAAETLFVGHGQGADGHLGGDDPVYTLVAFARGSA